MKVAVLGGSFNPLHIGHATLADTVARELGYDKVLIVPLFIPPHKLMKDAASPDDRLGLVKAFCSEDSRFEAEDCEIVRGGVSYTYDTLLYIIQKYGDKLDGKPAFIMGQEIASEFGKWHRADEVAQIADLVIARRHPDNNNVNTAAFENCAVNGYTGGFVPDTISATFAWPHKTLENPMLPVSSTEIRARIAQGKSWRYLVPEPVFEYIKEHKLYGYR